MQAGLRPYATAGVALVGAGVIAVSPLAVPPAATEDVRDTAVELSALTNPIGVLEPILQKAFDDAQAVLQRTAADPTPILSQILVNEAAGIGNIGDALESQVGVLPHLPTLIGQAIISEAENLGTLGGLSHEFLQNVIDTVTGGALRDQLQRAVDTARGGDFGGAFADLALVPLLLISGPGLENLILLPQFVPALAQPLADAAKLFPIAAGPLANGEAVIAALPDAALGLGIGALTPVVGVATAAGDTIDGLMEAVRTRNPELVFNTIVTEAGVATSSLLDGALDPNSGIGAGLQGLREAIAAAITTPTFPPHEQAVDVANVPGVASHSVTLTTPRPEIAAAPKAGDGTADAPSPSGTANASGGVTSSGGKGTTTNGNLFTPGTNAGKGGRHRADTGPGLAQGLKDAAQKSIKGLTGLGRDHNSESSASSASKNSGSGGSSHGSGSGAGA